MKSQGEKRMSPTPQPLQTGHRDRIRKKFLSAGLESFLDHEVLEFLLTYSIPRKDTKPLAWKLLKNFGSLTNVLDASTKELLDVPGIGKQTALFIPFVRALLKRYTLSEITSRPSGVTPEAVINYCKASLSDKKEEFLQILFLSTRHTIIGSKIMSTGNNDKVEVQPRDILGEAFACKAVNFILVHNHPSGDPEPSPEDIKFTRALEEAAFFMGIGFSDHIIVGKGKIFSFREHHLM